MHRVSLLVSAALLGACASAQRPGPVHAFVGAHLIPIAGAEIDKGVLLVRDGKILGVGGADLAVPEGAVVHDMAGKTILPGLVCTHSHVGGPAGGDRSSPIQPDCRVFDAIDVRDAGFKKALSGGLTTLNIMPGSGHLLSGQTVYVKLRKAHSIEDLVYRWEDGAPRGGMKMANGTNSIRTAPFPGTRAKSAALVRALFVRAKDYVRKREAARAQGEDFEIKLGMEGMAEVLSGRRIVHHHTHRHDDVLTVLRLADEFGFRVVLHHVSEAWKIADEIAAAGAPCSLILVDSPGGKLEAKDIVFENGKVLEERGVKVAFHTDDSITDSRVFRRMAALGVRAGMSRTGALRALTLSGAEMLDLQDRVGSLEAGKDADFVVLSGDPFSVYTRTLETWVEGEKVFDLADPEDRLYAEGGYGASVPQVFNMCCFQKWGENQ